jgi:hypothetical protein
VAQEAAPQAEALALLAIAQACLGRETMKPISTTVSENSVHFRLADETDPAKAREWIDILIKRTDLKIPSGTAPHLEIQYLSVLQIAALNHALQLIQDEIRRLKNMNASVN